MPNIFKLNFPSLAFTASCLVASVVLTLRWLRQRSTKALEQGKPGSARAVAKPEVSSPSPKKELLVHTEKKDLLVLEANDLNSGTGTGYERQCTADLFGRQCSELARSISQGHAEPKSPLKGNPFDTKPKIVSPSKVDVAKPTSVLEGSSVVGLEGEVVDELGPSDSDGQKVGLSTPLTPPNMCLTCGKYDGKMLRCSRCESVCFCSVECQRVAWKTHKSDCALLARAKKIKVAGDSSVKDASQSEPEASAVPKSGRVSSDEAVARHQEEGIHLSHEGKHADALNAFNSMLSTAQGAELVNDEGLALRLIGDALDKSNAPSADVEDAYKRALKIAHQKDDMELSFYCLTGMASHACKTDDEDLAEHFYLQGLTLAQRVLTHFEEGLAEGSLAMCLARTPARVSESFPHFRKAIALQKGAVHSTPQLHCSFASALGAANKHKEAQVEYQRALELARKAGNREVEAAALEKLSAVVEG